MEDCAAFTTAPSYAGMKLGPFGKFIILKCFGQARGPAYQWDRLDVIIGGAKQLNLV